MFFNPKNWYWFVDGDITKVFSSASMSFVTLADTNYAAWFAAGNAPTPISAADLTLLRIDWLEQSITPRMQREAQAGSTVTFAAGPNAGKTSAQVIAAVDAAIVTLRASL